MTTERKAALRKEVLRLRDALPPADRGRWSRRIFSEVLALPAYARAHTVLAYASFGSEPETHAFLMRVLADGKALLLPRVEPGGLALYRVRDPAQDLVPGTWGIREPVPDICPKSHPGHVDFVLVPGVAFDREGGRLGYGGGYYDRLLAGSIRSRASLVAAAFEVQIVRQVPRGPHDAPVDAVITEKTADGNVQKG